MDEACWTPGAWPLHGLGPREGLPPGLVWPLRRRDPDGPTDWQTRSGGFRPVGGGLWVPSDVELSVGQRVVEAASRLPAHGAVTGWAALAWLGGRWFEGIGLRMEPRPVTLALGSRHTLRPDRRIVVSQELVPVGEIAACEASGSPARCGASPSRCGRPRSDEAAVVAFEMAAYDDWCRSPS